MAATGKSRKTVFTLKLALGIGLLSVIFSRLDVRELITQIGSANVAYILLAVFFQLVAKLIWTSRWQSVLRLNGIQHRFWRLFGIVHIGLFFNNFLPSSIGGDAIRGYYTSNSKEGLAKSYGSLIIERTVGFLALALMVAIAVSYAIFRDTLQSFEVLLNVAGIGSIFLFAFGMSLLFWDGWHRPMQIASNAFPAVSKMVSELSESVKMFRRASWRGRLPVIVSSAALQVVAVCFYLACARSLGISTPIVLFFVIIPVTIVVAMLPISLNGLGVRETTLIALLVHQGIDETQVGAFAILALAISTAFSLVGGIIYIFWRPRHTSDV